MRANRQNSFKRPVQLISSVTAFLFLFTSLLQASPQTSAFQVAAAPVAKLSSVADLFAGLPETAGVLESSWQPDQLKTFHIGKNPFVILFQEVHANPATQINIAKTLDHIHKKLKNSGIERDLAIGIEGAPLEKIDLSLFKAFPIKEAVRDVSGSFLAQGQIDAAKYFSINYQSPAVNLFGLENEALYEKNLDAYRTFQPDQENVLGKASALHEIVRSLRKKVYRQSLLALEISREKFKKDSVTLPLHLRLLENLAKKKNIPLSGFPHIQELGILIRNLDKAKKSSALFHFPLKKSRAFFMELERLESKLEKSLSRSSDEELLVRGSRYALLIEKLTSLSLMPDEYESFKKHYHSLKDINFWEKLSDLLNRREGKRLDLQEIKTIISKLPSAILFYETALSRDAELGRSVERLTKTCGSKIVIAVAGGFHRDGLTRYLSEKNISFAVISPNSGAVADRESYWNLLSRGSKPLYEMIFEAQKQTLRPADRPITAETVLALVGSIPSYSGNSLGQQNQWGALYQGVIERYKDSLSALPSNPEIQRALKLLDLILAQINRSGNGIELNKFEIELTTKQGKVKLKIFVQRWNPGKGIFEPPIPGTQYGYNLVSQIEKADLGAPFNSLGQIFKLSVIAPKNSALAKSIISAQPAFTEEKTYVLSDTDDDEESEDSEPEPAESLAANKAGRQVTPRQWITRAIILLFVSFLAIAGIKAGFKKLAERKEDQRIQQALNSSRQMTRRILDEIWKKNFSEADKLLDEAERDFNLSLPIPKESISQRDLLDVKEIPKNVQFAVLRHLVKIRREFESEIRRKENIRFPYVHRMSSFSDHDHGINLVFGGLSNDKADLHTLNVIPENDLLLIQLYEIKAYIFRFRNEIPLAAEHGTTPGSAVDKKLSSLLVKAEAVLDKIKIPDSLKDEFNTIITELLEYYDAVPGSSQQTKNEIAKLRNKFAAHASYSPMPKDTITKLQTQFAQLASRRQNYILWRKLLEQMLDSYKKDMNAFLGGSPGSDSSRQSDFHRQISEIGTAQGSINYRSATGEKIDVPGMAFIALDGKLFRGLQSKWEKDPSFLLDSPYIADNVQFSIQRREGDVWKPELPENPTRFPGVYPDYVDEDGVQYRLVYLIARKEKNGKSLGAVAAENPIPIVMPLNQALLSQALDSKSDFRTDYLKQPIIFLMPEISEIRKLEAKSGQLLKDRNIHVLEWKPSLARTNRQDLANLLNRIKARIGSIMFPQGRIDEILPEELIYIDDSFQEDWGEGILRITYDKSRFLREDYRSALLSAAVKAFGNQFEWNFYFAPGENNTYSIIETVLQDQMRIWHSSRESAQAA